MHPILNLACTEPACEYKTDNTQSLLDHKKEVNERNVCKDCNTITVGTAHKATHEKTVHENEIVIPHLHASKETPAQKKGWVQPKKTFINMKVQKLQTEVDKLNKDGNIYNHLHSIPEITDTKKIRLYPSLSLGRCFFRGV